MDIWCFCSTLALAAVTCSYFLGIWKCFVFLLCFSHSNAFHLFDLCYCFIISFALWYNTSNQRRNMSSPIVLFVLFMLFHLFLFWFIVLFVYLCSSLIPRLLCVFFVLDHIHLQSKSTCYTTRLQVYMGELRNKCVKNVPDGWNVTHDEWKM